MQGARYSAFRRPRSSSTPLRTRRRSAWSGRHEDAMTIAMEALVTIEDSLRKRGVERGGDGHESSTLFYCCSELRGLMLTRLGRRPRMSGLWEDRRTRRTTMTHNESRNNTRPLACVSPRNHVFDESSLRSSSEATAAHARSSTLDRLRASQTTPCLSLSRNIAHRTSEASARADTQQRRAHMSVAPARRATYACSSLQPARTVTH